MICSQFCTVNCVDGSCPIALIDEYAERGMDVIYSCNECIYHTSCDDCDWQNTEMCSENRKIKDSTELSGGHLW